MGSDSDLPVMNAAAEMLTQFEVPFELTIVSAHRTPKRMVDFAENAHKNTPFMGCGIQIQEMFLTSCLRPVSDR